MTTDATYRHAIAELEAILRALETDTVDVDELTTKVQRSSELIRLCKQKLRAAETAIDRVFDDLDEEPDWEPTGEPVAPEATSKPTPAAPRAGLSPRLFE
ncbi:exodeoxyribonuclease VII small subunit [Hymenobacter lutimineralis]|uniref:Exodeoxyribonuclease VII small subunit n=1 Tax=Hymenobacter lutimineralis TaxID=2606448 RepID=A0A5D6VAA6_9BACT|nr:MULTISPECIES: exodeoxyribonuclease VII small subunit [Hymenobacter]QIX62590.1 exodeoxyribonuclease VII small subunit [Hymenobacter sp. BT18]TYZ11848.1 exodeoxyribonuclease VII small subunit [Hymenobacter lutimineralis]